MDVYETLYIGSNGHVAAIQPETGEELWRAKLSAGGAFGSPGRQDVCVLQHRGLVFTGCYGHLFCLHAETGEILWSNSMKGLGHNDVTLAIGDKAVQFVASHTHSSS
jgi:outer membrane protein assembly factor BamB